MNTFQLASNSKSCAIAQLNEFLSPGRLRAYQYQLACHGQLHIDFEHSEAQLLVEHGVLVDRHSFWLGSYDQSMKREIWFLASGISYGFPLVQAAELYWKPGGPAVGDIISVYLANWGCAKRDRLSLQSLLHVRPLLKIDWLDPSRNASPLVIVGDQNFAHHAWNELSAVDEFVLRSTKRDLVFAQTRFPLGRIDDIYPELHQCPVVLLPGGLYHDPAYIPVRLGSTLLSAATVGRLKRLAKKRITSYAYSAEREFFPCANLTLWVNISLGKRKMLNAVAFYSRLFSLYLEWSDGLRIVVDGYSLQFDAFSDLVASGQSEYDRVRAITELVGVIFGETCSKNIAYSDRLLSLNGAAIYDAIHLASHASYCVSPPGTVQHKIGWFYGTKGVIIGAGNLEREAQRASALSEVASLPACLPSNLIREASNQADRIQRGRDFEIIDIQSACDYILSDFRRSIGI